MDNIVRRRIPSLSSAPTAPAFPNRTGQGTYNYNSGQLFTTTGDGIRVNAGNEGTSTGTIPKATNPNRQGQVQVENSQHPQQGNRPNSPSQIRWDSGKNQNVNQNNLYTAQPAVRQPLHQRGSPGQIRDQDRRGGYSHPEPDNPGLRYGKGQDRQHQSNSLSAHYEDQQLPQFSTQPVDAHHRGYTFDRHQQHGPPNPHQSQHGHDGRPKQTVVMPPQPSTLYQQHGGRGQTYLSQDQQPQFFPDNRPKYQDFTGQVQQHQFTTQMNANSNQYTGQTVQHNVHYTTPPARSAHLPPSNAQSAAQFSKGHSDNRSFCYEWMTDYTGKKFLVRTPISPQFQDTQHQQQWTLPPSTPLLQPSSSVRYQNGDVRYPQMGQQYQPQGNNSHSQNIQAAKYKCRIHPHTGLPYQVQVTPLPPSPAGMVHQSHFQPTPPFGHSQGRHQNDSQQQLFSHGMERSQQSFLQPCDKPDNTLSRNERVAGIVSLLEGGTTKKVPKVLEFAKKCPSKWSKLATMNNINLPLYAWGAVAELESSMSGRSQAMSEGVVLGKLRHLKHALEICCQNSNATDFTGYGWTLARDYVSKVSEEVDQQLIGWQDLEPAVRTATLVSAQMENPRPPPKHEFKIPTNPRQPDKKEPCTSYNKCTTEGKCDYEVAHPDKVCQKKHECSWCKVNKKQSWRHQAWKCKNKEH